MAKIFLWYDNQKQKATRRNKAVYCK